MVKKKSRLDILKELREFCVKTGPPYDSILSETITANDRKVREDAHGYEWCTKHKCMLVTNPRTFSSDCPFCYLDETGKCASRGTCPDDCAKCFIPLAEQAVKDKTAPWMTKHGKKTYQEAMIV